MPDGARLVPTYWARVPWSPDSLHGDPVAATVARATERSVPADNDLRMIRLTLELLRPVSTEVLTVTSTLVRPGRKVQVVHTIVEQSGVEVAWGWATRIRVDPALVGPVPATPEDPVPDLPSAGAAVPSTVNGYRGFHNAGVEIRYVASQMGRPGPAAAWFRLLVPVVAGEVPSPEQRAAAMSDFGNGISAELTVHLLGPPDGGWVCLDAPTRFGPPGTALAESALWDQRGRLGLARQSLCIEPDR